MDNFITTLKVLNDVLEKKQAALTDILNITQNQETILLSPPSEERNSFFTSTTAEKQRLIDNVLEFDMMFQRFFDGIKDRLNEADSWPRDVKGKVVKIQGMINVVLELDVAIRAQEAKNNKLLNPGPKALYPAPTAARRKQALDALNKHKKV